MASLFPTETVDGHQICFGLAQGGQGQRPLLNNHNKLSRPVTVELRLTKGKDTRYCHTHQPFAYIQATFYESTALVILFFMCLPFTCG